jgi:hypothetical protein
LIGGYILISANDVPERDPGKWDIEFKNVVTIPSNAEEYYD